jgi:hypothetical protein
LAFKWLLWIFYTGGANVDAISNFFIFCQGPGCKTKCYPKDNQRTSTFAAIFLNKTHNWPKSLLDNMHFAASILKKYGTPKSLDTERPTYLHVTFDYYCCYTENEAVKIGEFLNSYKYVFIEIQPLFLGCFKFRKIYWPHCRTEVFCPPFFPLICHRPAHGWVISAEEGITMDNGT